MLQGFTDDQLRAMDIYQAGSFTNEQYNSMSETSRKIIYDKIEPMIDEFGDPRESGEIDNWVICIIHIAYP